MTLVSCIRFPKTSNLGLIFLQSHLYLQLIDFVCSNAVAQAEAFADNFSEGSNHEPITFTFWAECDSSLNFSFAILELKNSISKTWISSPLQVKISAALFKGFNDHYLECLLTLHNRIWHSGDAPASWRSASIQIQIWLSSKFIF